MRIASLLVLTGSLVACSDDSPPVLPQGQWSAADVNLFVTSAGTTLELTCREAFLPGTLALTSRGEFRVDTTIATFGITVSYSPASIRGRLDRGELRLTVISPAAGSPQEEYLLERRAAPHLPRCG